MPTMVMNRNWTVATTSGHCIGFKKDEPVHVPQDLKVIQSCLQYGAKFVDEKDESILEPADTVTNMPRTPSERRDRILALMGEMKENQAEHRLHFTGSGRPAVKYMATALGFDITAGEIEDLWNQVLHPAE